MEKQKIDKNYIDQLRTMRMFDVIAVAIDAQMQRVPGGWIYHAWNAETSDGSSCCFIPLTDNDPLMGGKNDL